MRAFALKPNQPSKGLPANATGSILAQPGPDQSEYPVQDRQRPMGDQALEQLPQTNSEAFHSPGAAASQFVSDFCRIPVHAGQLQPMPKLNAPGKEYEKTRGLFDDSAGHRLDPDLRSWFEQRMGQDFGDVRIYRGPQTDEATRKHGAIAATIGRNIAIHSAAAETHTDPGLFALAHELVHTAQQRDATGPVSENPNAAAEHQARALAPSLLVPGSRPPIHRVARPSLMFLSAASGQQSLSSSGTITADLTSPIVVGRTVRFQVELVPPLTYTPATKMAAPYPHYLWTVFDRDTNAKVAEGWSAANRKNIAYPRAGKFRVECLYVDPSKGETPPITLEQDVVSEYPTLAGQLSSNSDYGEAERELVDDFRSYVQDAAASTGAQGITPRFLASILREEIANTDPWPFGFSGSRNKGARQRELSDVNTAIQKRASGATVPTKDIDRSVGVAQMKLSTAAMLQGLIPWIEQDPQNKQPARAQISANFSTLSTANLSDLHTLLAWPKSNINTAAAQLARLKNRLNRYPAMSRAAFGSDQRACEIIATEYNVGATNSPEALANPSDYGRRTWSYMSLPLIKNFFVNS